jgi:hypothetical protein
MKNMKNLLKKSLLLSSILLITVNAVRADIIYDNGVASSESTGGRQINFSSGFGWPTFTANQFTLSDAATIESVSFANLITAGQTVTALNWYIVANPFDAATEPLYQGSASSLNSVFKLNMSNVYYVNEVTFNVSPFTLNAGTYWLALGNATVSGGGNAFWMNDPSATNPVSPYYGYGTVGGSGPSAGSPAVSIGPESSHAFQLYGTAAVPEPSTYALLGLGALAWAAFGRRKKA